MFKQTNLMIREGITDGSARLRAAADVPALRLQAPFHRQQDAP